MLEFRGIEEGVLVRVAPFHVANAGAHLMRFKAITELRHT